MWTWAAQPIVNGSRLPRRRSSGVMGNRMNAHSPVPSEADSDLVPGVRLAPDGLRFTFSRASGPGGQNVNKLSTRAELRVSVGDLIGLDLAAADRLRQFAGKRLTRDDEIAITAGTHRSQLDNKAECVARLRDLVIKAMVRPKTRRKTKPSRGAKERRLQSKRLMSEKKAGRRVTNDE
jgi:ribosome-associated protein